MKIEDVIIKKKKKTCTPYYAARVLFTSLICKYRIIQTTKLYHPNLRLHMPPNSLTSSTESECIQLNVFANHLWPQ